MQHGDHPRYFARVPGPSSFAGVLGDWLGTGFNAIAASWKGGSGPATVELVVLDWLRALLGMPEGTEGVLASGGSLANVTALATARAVDGPGVAYLSDQTHSSIGRGLVALGFAPGDVRMVPTDDAMRMPVAAVAAAIAEDRAAGRRPGFVVASAGTTNTGAVDPLHPLADLCAEQGLWFHVDGAYGAPAALCEPGRRVLAGIERADSLVLDPHKWLFQPYDVGCLLVRRPGALDRAFHMTPEYLLDVAGIVAEVDFRNRSLELSRRSRALKLWLTFHTYGLERIRRRDRTRHRAGRARRSGCSAPTAGSRSSRPRSSASSPSRCAARRTPITSPRATGDRGRRLRGADHHVAARAVGAAAVHDQPADHRGRPGGHDRADLGVLEQSEHVAVGVGDACHQPAAPDVVRRLLHGRAGSGHIGQLRLDVRDVPVCNRRAHALVPAARH